MTATDFVPRLFLITMAALFIGFLLALGVMILTDRQAQLEKACDAECVPLSGFYFQDRCTCESVRP